jgi:hypothetical protein
MVSKMVGLQVNAEKTWYISMPMFIKNATQFKHLGTVVTYQNYIHKEIKSRLNSGRACYLSVQTILSSLVLSKSLKTKLYKTKVLPVVLHGCGTWSLRLKE